MRPVRCDREGDMRALDAADLPALGEHTTPECRKTSGLATENPRKNLRLALVDEEAGGSLGLSRPQIALPSPDPNKAQIIERDVAVVALPDMPKQNRLTDAVIRSLRKGARTRDGTAAIVEPVSGDVPAGNLGHGSPFVDRTDLIFAASGRLPPNVNPLLRLLGLASRHGRSIRAWSPDARDEWPEHLPPGHR